MIICKNNDGFDEQRSSFIIMLKSGKAILIPVCTAEHKKNPTRVHTWRSVARFAIRRLWQNGTMFDIGLLPVGHPYTLYTARFHTSTSATQRTLHIYTTVFNKKDGYRQQNVRQR